MWYWHSPFNVSPSELSLLKGMGVNTLYVRAATFTTDGVRLSTMMPVQWQNNAGGMPVVLVFNFDAGLLKHYRQFSNTTVAPEMVAGISKAEERAKDRGIHVGGVQIDIDCPTRLLPKYGELLGQVRSGLAKQGLLAAGQTFSATALQTWLTSPGFEAVVRACDFTAPQFYEGRVGKTLDKVQPIADIRSLRAGLSKASAFGGSFQVGLAAYGHALLYDQNSRLVGMYHGLAPSDALRHPALQAERACALSEDGSVATAANYAGEDLLTLRAIQPDMRGNGLGFHVAYVLPSAEMLRQQLEVLRAARPSNCTGVILYRFPEANDELAVPLAAVARAMSGGPANLDLKVALQRRAVPWSLIGTGKSADKPPYDYTVSVRSIGTSPTMAGRDALSVLVMLSGTGLEDAGRGDFDEAVTGQAGADGSFQPCAPAHADAVLLRSYHVMPGALLRSGAIETAADGPQPASVSWVARKPGGFASVGGSLSQGFKGAGL